MDKIIENLKSLCDLLESRPVQPSLVIESGMEKFSNLLTPEASELLKTRFKELVFPRPERKTIYLSAIGVGEEGVRKAMEVIAEEVNTIASVGKLLGCLAPLSTMKLIDIWTKDGQYCGYRDAQGVDHFEPGSFVKAVLKGPLLEKPEGAILEDSRSAVFCFVTVPWDFEPDGLLYDLKLYRTEGEIGDAIYK